MVGLRTCAAVLLLVLPQIAWAFPVSPSQRVQLFAVCTGRFSALAEHKSLFGGPDTDSAYAEREVFEDLLAATLPDALDWGLPPTRAMEWRLTAKMAQKRLLDLSVFHDDPRVARRAGARAAGLMQECRALSLGV